MSKILESIQVCQARPDIYIETILGNEMESYQREICEAVLQNDRVAVSSSHNLGKSWIAARMVLWFASCHPGAKVVTTAPTFLQVRSILWAEIRSAHAKARVPLGGQMNQTEWQLSSSGDWFAIGLTSRNEVQAEQGQGTSSSFQGWHAPHILLLFDEATGIQKQIWDQAEGILTSGNVKFLAIGNPTSRISEFYKCFSSPAWKKIKLSCFDSPNLLVNGICDEDSLTAEIQKVRSMNDIDAQARLKSYAVIKPHLLSLKWVVQSAIKWGTEHPLFVSKVLGQFPEDADGTLISLSTIEESQRRIYYPVSPDAKRF